MSSDLSRWKRLLGYLHGLYPWITLAIFLLIAAKTIEVIVPTRLGDLLQQVIDGRGGIWTAGGFIVVLLILAYLLEAAVVFMINWLGQTAIYRLRTSLFRHVQSLHIRFFDQQRVGQIISRVIADVDRLQAGFSDSLASMISSALMVVAIAIGIYLVDWRVALLISFLFPLLALLAWRFGHRQRQLYTLVRRSLGMVNTFVQEHLVGAAVIRNFSLAAQEKPKFDRANEEFRHANVETIRHFAVFIAGIEWFQSAVLTLVFVGLFLFGAGTFQAGTFFTFSLYMMLLFRPIRDIVDRYNTLQKAFAASARVFALFDEKPQIRKRPPPREIASIESITFENVSFAYNTGEWILTDLSFEMKAGESTAIVGETGAGKSTVLSLLTRFHDPQKGQITLNGRDLRDYPIDTLRRQFATVLQDPVLFSGTIRDNVTLFNDQIAPERVEEALRQVGASAFVGRLPRQVETLLHEQGRGLSVGEKQLISLARAIIDPSRLLLLDEATANIDTVTERIIQETLSTLLTQQTSLVIAHRLSTILASDQILVLHRGHLVERGTHTQLLAEGGIYANLHRWQFRD